MRMAKKANVAPGTTTTTTAPEETGKTADQGTASKLKVRKWPRDRRGSSGGREGTTVTGGPGTRKTVSRKDRMERPGGTTIV